MFNLLVNEPVDSGIRRILDEKIIESAALMADFDAAPEAAVHALRKNLKRVRAALRMVSDSGGGDSGRELEHYFRDLGRRFADLRDATVRVETLSELSLVIMEPGMPEPFPAIRQKITLAKETLYASALESSQIQVEAVAALGEGQDRLNAMDIRLSSLGELRPALRKAYRRTQKAFQAAYQPPLHAEKFHEWRKRVKLLWHQCEILLPAIAGSGAERTEDLEHLSGLLGKAHDFAALQRWLAVQGDGVPDGELAVLTARLRRSRTDFEGAARPHGEALLAAPFKRFEVPFFEGG